MSDLFIRELNNGVIDPHVTEIDGMLKLICYQREKHHYKINGGDAEYLHLECKDCGLILSHFRRLLYPIKYLSF